MGISMRYQPQGRVRINMANPLSRGLVFAWVPANSTLLSSGSPTQVFTPMGSGLGTNSSNYVYSNSAPAFSLSECSITAILTPTNTNASGTYAVSCGNSTNTIPLFLLGNGGSSGMLQFRVRDASNIDTQLQATDPRWTNGTTAIVTGTRSASGATQSLYLQGGLLNQYTGVGAPVATTFDRFAIGGLLRSSFALGWVGTTSLVLIHNRALSPEEAQSLAVNPWQVFEVGSASSMYQAAIVAVSGGTVTQTGSLAWTEASDSTSISALFTDPSSISWIESSDTYTLPVVLTNRTVVTYTESDDSYNISLNVAGSGGTTLTWTEVNDAYNIIGTVYDPVIITWTEANDSHSTAMVLTNNSINMWTEDNDTASITGILRDFVSLGWTESNDGILFLPSPNVGSGRRRKGIHK